MEKNKFYSIYQRLSRDYKVKVKLYTVIMNTWSSEELTCEVNILVLARGHHKPSRNSATKRKG